MTLTAGTRLGHYEIIEAAGSGGMGEVYRAKDVRLDRDVAVKTIKGPFTERFEREARAISSLNHPNICTLHDVGEHDGSGYLVMEYIEGKPVAGPMPVEQACAYGVQICEALHAAHRKGIVHRDLKPANILLTKQGVKLLDFGLAKLSASGNSGAVSGPQTSMGEQATVAALTGAHTVVGTPQYMAPEQIEAREVDARTDIFAFGCVLYELITGHRAFDGKTSSSVMAAVLATKPRPIDELVPLTPPALERIVSRCLAKDPEDRWQSARDVAAELQWVSQGGSKVGLPAVVTVRRRTREGPRVGGLRGGGPGGHRVLNCVDTSRSGAAAGGAVPADLTAGRAESQPAGHVAQRSPYRVCRRRRWQAPDLGARARLARGAAACGHRWRPAAVLVARQPLPRVHGGRQAEEGGHRRRAATDHLRCAIRRRRQLEPGGRHPARRPLRGSAVACACSGRCPSAVCVRGRQAGRHAGHRVAGVPAGRQALPVHDGRHAPT